MGAEMTTRRRRRESRPWLEGQLLRLLQGTQPGPRALPLGTRGYHIRTLAAAAFGLWSDDGQPMGAVVTRTQYVKTAAAVRRLDREGLVQVEELPQRGAPLLVRARE